MDSIYRYHIVWTELLLSFALLLLIILAEACIYKSTKRLQEHVLKWKLYLRQQLIEPSICHDVQRVRLKTNRHALLIALEDFDATFSDHAWTTIKHSLMTSYLLPWARCHVISLSWESRHIAARIFLRLPLSTDLPWMYKLLNDRDFYIRMIICEAIGKLQLPETMELLIEKMSQETILARFIYRYVIHQASESCLKMIVHLAEKTTSEEILLCCLDVLTHRFSASTFPFIHQQLCHPSLEIRQHIARMLRLIPSEEALLDLMILSSDTEAQVRQSALHSLRAWKDPRVLSILEHGLQDPEYLVRLEAATTLKNYGKEGERILELQDSDLHPLAHDIARFVLTAPA